MKKLLERLQIAYWYCYPLFGQQVRRPVVEWLQTHVPTWFLLHLLEYWGDGRYRISTRQASVHLMLRLGPECRGREEDLIRIVHGRCVAFGWMEEDGTFGSQPFRKA